MKVRFLDLAVSDLLERSQLLASFQQVLDSGQLILGPEVQLFESQLARYCQRDFAVSVASGTDALILAIKSLNLPENSEIITTPLSWVASSNAIILSGHIPVFADIDQTLNLDAGSVLQHISSKTSAILSVDFAGQLCDYKSLKEICISNGLKLIQDLSQALGASSSHGVAGSQGDISAVSHNSMKTLGALGEAGSVLCDEPRFVDQLKILRYAGTINRENCILPSTNSRIDTIQAAFLSVRLKYLSNIVRKRSLNAQFYNDNLHPSIIRPIVSDFTIDHAFYTYQCQLDQRDLLADFLQSSGIETKVQHKLLIPHHDFYKNKFSGSWQNAEVIVKRTLCLPVHEKLTLPELSYTVEKINEFCSRI